MSNKGDTKKEMMDRFKSMGIPTPVKPITNPQVPSKNPEMASKMDQIRNGAMAANFKQFIDKAEKTSSMPTTIPVPKVGKNPNEKAKNVPQLSSFSPKSNPQASMIEAMMYGGSSAPTTQMTANSEVGDFGPQNVDIRSKLQQRLAAKQNEVNNSEYVPQTNYSETQLTDAELTEKITEVAKKVSKDMIKNVIMELSKTKGGLIMESKNVKKAEIVAKNKVKIDGKVYKLTLDK